jgi:hypothetical protein
LTNHKKKPTTSSSTNIRSAVAVHPSLTPPPKPKPKPKNRSKLGHDDNEPLQSPPPLPNGSYESWEFFLDNEGYKLTTDERISVKRFVKPKRSNPVVVAEGIKFHRLVKGMRAQLSNSPRDAWDLVLPAKSHSNFEICCLFLMIATPAVTDDSIIQVFGPLFLHNNVTPAWVLREGEDGITNWLRAFGRQTMTARYIVTAASTLVVKMETEKERKGMTDNEYKVARASIEGWFPKVAWGELNQTWAGLGQLLNKKDARKKIAEYVDSESKSWTSIWRAADRTAMSLLLKAY